MRIKRAVISATLGCLSFSAWSGSSAADEIRDQFGTTLYGYVAGFTGNGVVFHQNCAEQGQPFAWEGLDEVRFSNDCSVAKSWRGGGDPPCEDPATGLDLSVPHPGFYALSVEPETVTPQNQQIFASALELLGRGKDVLTYRDLCTGAVKTIPTRDLIVRSAKTFCKPQDCP